MDESYTPEREYHYVWEIPSINKIHDEDASYEEIDFIFAYCFNKSLSSELPEVLRGMKKGQTATYSVPDSDEKITITALKDTFLPF